MITIMRKHHKVLMIFITALVCISFSWYWNRTDFSQMGNGVIGTIYDHKVSQVEFQRNARLLRLSSELGMHDLVQSLTIGAQTENEAYSNFSWNLMVLQHEADALGIKPTTEEIANLVKTLPAFQSANGFDMAKYTDFADHALAPMGFSEAEIEELASDQITLDRVKNLLAAGVSVADAQLRSDFERAYSKMDVAVVRFQAADFAKDVQVTDDDVAKYFDAHKAELKTEEKREVQFVRFGLTDEQKKLTGRERIDVLQKLADDANDFTDALQAKGAEFSAVAAKFKMKPEETAEFTADSPAPQFAQTPELTKAAFALTKDTPNSDAVQAQDGFYIEHLAKIDSSRPLTLDEARPKIVESLKQERLQALVAAKAGAVVKQLRDAVKSGKPVEQAAAAAGVKAETIPSFALLDNPPGAPIPRTLPTHTPPDMDTIKQTVSGMNPGSVSDFVPSPAGGLVVVLEKRAPLDVAQFNSSRPLLETRMLSNERQIVFYEWLRDRRRAAGVEENRPQQVANS
ncbi:MAG TPA: SurA N-terminal domain-containing protein [Chthoniobacterales bacterium]